MANDESRQDLLRRLRRIEGQVKGIQRMIEERRSCEDIVVQLSAARAALDTVAARLVVNHATDCLDTLPPGEARAAIGRAIRILSKMPQSDS